MMGVAQALLTEPRVLLDQPATVPDPALEASLTEALIRRRGAMTIVMVTHRRSHMRLAQDELRLEAGRVAHGGAPLDPPPSRTGAAR